MWDSMTTGESHDGFASAYLSSAVDIAVLLPNGDWTSLCSTAGGSGVVARAQPCRADYPARPSVEEVLLSDRQRWVRDVLGKFLRSAALISARIGASLRVQLLGPTDHELGPAGNRPRELRAEVRMTVRSLRTPNLRRL